MNSVNLIGNLTRDPDLRYGTGENQTAICRFSIAVNDGYGEKKEVNYINIVSFGKVAENCERYLAKGRKVAIVGRIKTGSYNKQDGTKVYTTDVVASNVEFLSGQEQQKPPQGMSFTPAQGFGQQGFGQPQGFGQQPQAYVNPQPQQQQFGNFAQSPIPQQPAPPQQEPQQMQGFTALTDEEIPF